MKSIIIKRILYKYNNQKHIKISSTIPSQINYRKQNFPIKSEAQSINKVGPKRQKQTAYLPHCLAFDK